MKRSPTHKNRFRPTLEELEARALPARIIALDFDGATRADLNETLSTLPGWRVAGSEAANNMDPRSFVDEFAALQTEYGGYATYSFLDLNGDGVLNRQDGDLAAAEIMARVDERYLGFDVQVVRRDDSVTAARELINNGVAGDALVFVWGWHDAGGGGQMPDERPNRRDDVGEVGGSVGLARWVVNGGRRGATAREYYLNTVANLIAHEVGHSFGLGHITVAARPDANGRDLMIPAVGGEELRFRDELLPVDEVRTSTGALVYAATVQNARTLLFDTLGPRPPIQHSLSFFPFQGVVRLTGDNQRGSLNDLIVIDVQGSDLVVSVNSQSSRIPLALVTSIVVDAGDGNDIVRVERTGGRPTTVRGGIGDDFIDFSFAIRNLGFVEGPTTVLGGGGTDSIFVYDDGFLFPSTYRVTASAVNRPDFGGLTYGPDVEGLTLRTGAAADVVNVPSTAQGTRVFLNNGGFQPETVNVGDASGLQNIRGELQVQNDPNYTTLNVNAGHGAGARFATIDHGFGFGSLAGLAPATIFWELADVSVVNITTGQGSDVVNVLRTGVPLNLSSTGGEDVINVGIAGRLDDIDGPVTIVNPPSFTTVNVNGSNDPTFRGNVRLETVSLPDGAYGQVTGLGGAPVRFKYADTRGINVATGVGGANVNVLATSRPTRLTAWGHSSVLVGNNGRLTDIRGELVLNNVEGQTHLTLDNSADPNSRTGVLINDLEVSNLAPASILFDDRFLSGLTVKGGFGPSTVTIADTPRRGTTRYESGSSGDAIQVQATSGPLTIASAFVDFEHVNTVAIGSNGSVQRVRGSVTLTNGLFAGTQLTVDNSADPVGRDVTIAVDTTTSRGTIAGLAPAVIAIPEFGLTALTLSTGGGSDRVTIDGAPYGTTSVYSGPGDDTITVRKTADTLSFELEATLNLVPGTGQDTVEVGNAAGSLDDIRENVIIFDETPAHADANTLRIHDEGSREDHRYTLTATSFQRHGLPAITFGTLGYDSLYINTGDGSNQVRVASPPGNYTWTYLETGTGRDLVDVLATPFASYLFVNSRGGSDLYRAGSAFPAPVTPDAAANLLPAGGSLAGLQAGIISFGTRTGLGTLILDNEGDPVAREGTFYGYGVMSGLAEAYIAL